MALLIFLREFHFTSFSKSMVKVIVRYKYQLLTDIGTVAAIGCWGHVAVIIQVISRRVKEGSHCVIKCSFHARHKVTERILHGLRQQILSCPCYTTKVTVTLQEVQQLAGIGHPQSKVLCLRTFRLQSPHAHNKNDYRTIITSKVCETSHTLILTALIILSKVKYIRGFCSPCIICII